MTANWVQLVPVSAASAGGATLTVLPDNSILASGAAPYPDTYTVTADSLLQSITGIRLEMIEHPSFPANGPGRAGNGNYVLSEFSVASRDLPEPSTVLIWSLLAGLGVSLGWRRRTK